MSEAPKDFTLPPIGEGYWRVGSDPFGYAPIKAEGEALGYVIVGDVSEPEAGWLVRKTEWPRRKLARALERLADWICRDRDEGW